MGLPPEEESFPIREKYYSLSVLKKLKLSHYTPRRRLGGEKAQLHSFSNSAVDGGKWSESRPVRALPQGKNTAGTYCTGGLVGPKAGLDIQATGNILSPLPELEPRSPGRRARS
jgi:hypothetical protein